MSIMTVTYVLPNHLASALINGDTSGMEDHEIDRLNHWVNEKREEHGGLFYCVDAEDYGFHFRHDYGNGAADCGNFTFQVNSVSR